KRLRRDVNDMHFEEISRLGPIDEDWPGQGMDETEGDIEIDAAQVVDRHGRRDNAIERITRLHHHDIVRVNAQHRWNVRVPAVMPSMGLLVELFATINADCMGSHSYVLSPE